MKDMKRVGDCFVKAVHLINKGFTCCHVKSKG